MNISFMLTSPTEEGVVGGDSVQEQGEGEDIACLPICMSVVL